MLSVLIALAHVGEHAADYDESLGAAAWILAGVALLVAIVATWMVTARGDRRH